MDIVCYGDPRAATLIQLFPSAANDVRMVQLNHLESFDWTYYRSSEASYNRRVGANGQSAHMSPSGHPSNLRPPHTCTRI